MLAKFISPNQKDWDTYLNFITMAYNSSVNEATGVTPVKMIYGRELLFPIQLSMGAVSDQKRFSSDYIESLKDKIELAHSHAREHLNQSAERRKKQYDAGVRLNSKLEQGILVWRYQKRTDIGKKPKLLRHWSGPWLIINKLSDVLFEIKHSNKLPSVVVHGDNLKIYHGDKTITLSMATPVNTREEIPLPGLTDYQQTNGSIGDNHDRTHMSRSGGQDVGREIQTEMSTDLPHGSSDPSVLPPLMTRKGRIVNKPKKFLD